MSTAKSQPLHNFNLPSLLKWGGNGVATTSHRLRRPPPPPPQPQTHNGEADESSKPWKLRPRKPASYFHETNGGGGDAAVRVLGIPAVQSEGKNGGGEERKKEKEKEKEKEKQKRKLWIALSKEEIEEDVFVMTGSRPSRRPKKRAKNVQKQLDSVFPGLWLVGMTADAFRISEGIPTKK